MTKLVISASKLKTYDSCPKQYEFKYIQKLPWLEHDYFDTGKNVEALLFAKIKMEEPPAPEKPYTEEEKKMAESLYKFKPLQKLIWWMSLIYQRKHFDWDRIGFTDLETDLDIIDIKTSASIWNENIVKENRFQAKMYHRFCNWKKKFHFVIVLKKSDYPCQIISLNIKDYKDLEQIEMELKTAIELKVFPKAESYRCKQCDYSTICRQI